MNARAIDDCLRRREQLNKHRVDRIRRGIAPSGAAARSGRRHRAGGEGESRSGQAGASKRASERASSPVSSAPLTDHTRARQAMRCDGPMMLLVRQRGMRSDVNETSRSRTRRAGRGGAVVGFLCAS